MSTKPTYMFSPKVLDRANVIEFRMDQKTSRHSSIIQLPSNGKTVRERCRFRQRIFEAAADKRREVPVAVKDSYEREMLLFSICSGSITPNSAIAPATRPPVSFISTASSAGIPTGAATGSTAPWMPLSFRRSCRNYMVPGRNWKDCCGRWPGPAERNLLNETERVSPLRSVRQARRRTTRSTALKLFGKYVSKSNPDDPAAAARYPLSFDKVMRMWRKLVRDQFVTFAEA